MGKFHDSLFEEAVCEALELKNNFVVSKAGEGILMRFMEVLSISSFVLNVLVL